MTYELFVKHEGGFWKIYEEVPYTWFTFKRIKYKIRFIIFYKSDLDMVTEQLNKRGFILFDR
jgi:hypothetical protein